MNGSMCWRCFLQSIRDGKGREMMTKPTLERRLRRFSDTYNIPLAAKCSETNSVVFLRPVPSEDTCSKDRHRPYADQ